MLVSDAAQTAVVIQPGLLNIEPVVARGRANVALDRTNALDFRQLRLIGSVCALPVSLVR